MPRRARICIPGYPMHIVQRGHNRAPCFVQPNSHDMYLDLLQELHGECRCDIHAFVLMTNHVHLLVTPRTASAASELMRRLNIRFVRRMNDRLTRRGPGFESRFWSSVIESSGYFLRCQRYVEMNPVRAGLVAKPDQYSWSSHASNAYGVESALVTPHPEYIALGRTEHARRAAYRALFIEAVPASEFEAIRTATRANLVYGSSDFIAHLSAQLGRPLERRSPGRKKRDKHGSRSAMRETVCVPD
jgi:putative transposase